MPKPRVNLRQTLGCLAAFSALCLPVWAESPVIQAIGISPSQPEIHIQVTGGWLEPLLAMEPRSGNRFSLFLKAEGARFSPELQRQAAELQKSFARTIPAIQSIQFIETATGVQILLESLTPLRPQVKANTGETVSVVFVGETHPTIPVSSLPEKQAAIAVPEVSATENDVTKETPKHRLQWPMFTGKKAQPISQPAKQETALVSPDEPPATIESPDVAPARPVSSSISQSIPEESPEAESEEPHFQPLRLSKPPTGLMAAASPVEAIQLPAGSEPEATPSSTTENLPVRTVNPSVYRLVSDRQTSPMLSNAWKEMQGGRFMEALVLLEAYLTQGSPDPFNEKLGRLLLASVLQAQSAGISEPALERRSMEELQRLVKTFPDFQPAYSPLIEQAIRQSDYDLAEQTLESALSQWADDVQLLSQQGKLQELLNDRDAARRTYLRLLDKDPYHAQAHYRLAVLSLKEGRTEAARWELAQALLLSPDDSRVLKLMGYLADKQGKTGLAMHYYQDAAQADSLINLARVFHQGGQQAKALTLLQTVEILADGNPDLLFNLGMTYRELGEAGKATGVFQKFLAAANQKDRRIPQVKALVKK